MSKDNSPKGRKEEHGADEHAGKRKVGLGLRAAGWSEKKINDFILYIETGEDQYKPKPDKKTE